MEVGAERKRERVLLLFLFSFNFFRFWGFGLLTETKRTLLGFVWSECIKRREKAKETRKRRGKVIGTSGPVRES